MSGTEERRKSARQGRVKPTAHSSALESLRAAREGRESRAEQHDVRNVAVFRLSSSLVKGLRSDLALCFSIGIGFEEAAILIDTYLRFAHAPYRGQARCSSAVQCCACDLRFPSKRHLQRAHRCNIVPIENELMMNALAGIGHRSQGFACCASLITE